MSKNKIIYARDLQGGLARRPYVGMVIFVVATLLFAIIAYSVVNQGPLTASDASTVQAVHQWAVRSPWPIKLVAFGFSAFGREGIALIALILGVAWAIQGRWREFSLVFMGTAVGEGIFQVMSNGFNRHRPVFPDPLEKLPGPGFPSGHAISAVLLFGLCVYLLWPNLRTGFSKFLAILIAILINLAIGASRLFLGDHYPTDLIAGYIVGIAWGAFIFTVIEVVYRRIYRWRTQVSLGRQSYVPK